MTKRFSKIQVILLAAAVWLPAGLLGPEIQTIGPVRAAAGTRYVATDGDDLNDCSTIAKRCSTVQRAVDVAENGETIKVAAGIYTDVDITTTGYLVTLAKTVTLSGGYGTDFAEPPNSRLYKTVLDAENKGRVIFINGAGPTLEGFWFVNGEGSFSGGGLQIENATGAIIRNNQIRDNHANGDGGGIFINRGSAQILNNVIAENTATWAAGLRVINDADVLIHGNEISGNIAQISGGGVNVDCCGGGTATITDNYIADNEGGNSGGGILINVTNAILINNLLNHNHASQGDNLYVNGMDSYPANVDLKHNTLVGEIPGSEGIWVGEYVDLYLVNNILTGHPVGISHTAPSLSTLTAEYNLFWNVSDPITGTNAIIADPLLDSSSHLIEDSPAIDAGIDVGVSADFDGEARPAGPFPDIGADEFWRYAFLPVVLK